MKTKKNKIALILLALILALSVAVTGCTTAGSSAAGNNTAVSENTDTQNAGDSSETAENPDNSDGNDAENTEPSTAVEENTDQNTENSSEIPGEPNGEVPALPGDQSGEAPAFPGDQSGEAPAFPSDQNGAAPGFPGSQDSGTTGVPGGADGFGGMTTTAETAAVEDVISGSVTEGKYSTADAVTLTFTDSGITASGEGNYSIEGTSLSITGSGTYILSGNCSDGTVVVKKGVTGVTLVLNGLSLTSSDSAPITCNKSSEVIIYAADGSVNSLLDTEQNNDETYTENTNAENAVIKCKDGSNVTICGTGTINITANGKNGIKSGASTTEEGEASLTIEDVTLNITTYVNDGINAEAALYLLSGNVTVSAADDAIHSDLELVIGEEGSEGPNITVVSCCEGLEGASVNIYSGNAVINAVDDGINAANSDLTGYTFVININGGDIYVNTSSGDGIDSNGAINIYDGTVEIFSQSSGDNTPLDTETGVYIYGGTVLGVGCSGMGESISAEQAALVFSTNVTAGSEITIKDANDGTVYSATAVRNASYVVFSSDKLTEGSSYTLYVNNSESATATAASGTVGGMFGGGMAGSSPWGNAGGQGGQGMNNGGAPQGPMGGGQNMGGGMPSAQ